MKAILMSIKPRYVAKILNGEKTIEIRKRFPKDFRGWVYIYCTKSDIKGARENFYFEEFNRLGKVVARFWCDNVGVIKLNYCLTIPTIAYTTFADKYYSDNDLQVVSCLNGNELMKYLGTDKKEVGYAIPISQLEIFDEPKELSDFKRPKWNKCEVKDKNGLYQCDKCPYGNNKTLTCEYDKPIKAPQSRQYIEVEE